jgi:hypothetical protein
LAGATAPLLPVRDREAVMGRPSFGVDAALERAVTPSWEDARVAVHQAFCFELDPNDEARSALASHVGAARFAFNTMLAYVHWALDARAFERRTTGVAVTEVPWTLPSLRQVWNHESRGGRRRGGRTTPRRPTPRVSPGWLRLGQFFPITSRHAGRPGRRFPPIQKEVRPAVVSGDSPGHSGWSMTVTSVCPARE